LLRSVAPEAPILASASASTTASCDNYSVKKVTFS
jgi:hypothetical protein